MNKANNGRGDVRSATVSGLGMAALAALVGGVLAWPAQAQDQGANAETLLDLSTIEGQNLGDNFDALEGNIKRVCTGFLDTSNPHLASGRLQSDCGSLVGAAINPENTEAAVNAVEQVANEEVASQGTLGVENSQLQARNVASRMEAIQTGVSAPRLTLADFGLASLVPRTFSVALGVNGDEQIGGGFARTSIFLNGSFYTGEQDPNRFEKSFEWDSYAVTGGIDHRFTDNFFGGASVGYTNTEGDFDANGGEVESDNFTVSVFGSYYTDGGFYLDGSAAFGNTDYDTNRNVIYFVPDAVIPGLGPTPAANVNQVARSDTEGDEFGLSIGTGFNIQRGASTITPRFRVDYLDTEVDGYDEVMCGIGTGECRQYSDDPLGATGNDADGSGWALAVGDQEIESLRAALGVGWKTAVNRNWGVLLPYLNADFVHEFEDDARDVFFCFREDDLCPGSAGVATAQERFTITTAAPDRNFFLLSGGFVAQFAGGKIAFINLEHMAGNDDVEYTGVTAGLRFEFN